MRANPNDRTILSAADDDEDGNLMCLWVFANGMLVGIILAIIAVFAAIYTAVFCPELQQLR
jgi:hypothetical protein